MDFSALLSLLLAAAWAAGTPSATSIPSGQCSWTGFVDAVEKLFKIAAIIAGGIFAYYKFFRGRTFKPRLEPKIAAEIIDIHSVPHCKVVTTVKNVGLSKVPIDREASGLRFLTAAAVSAEEAEVHRVDWVHHATFRVFESHGWIEPGEIVEDHKLVAIPISGVGAVRLELGLAGPHEWTAEAVVVSTGRNSDRQDSKGVISLFVRRILAYLYRGQQ